MRRVFSDLDTITALLPELSDDLARKGRAVSLELINEISAERQAAIGQLFDSLAAERNATFAALSAADGLPAALSDLRLTVEATNELIVHLETMLTRIEPLMEARGGDGTGQAQSPDLQEYRDTAAGFTVMLERMNDTLGSLDALLASEGLPKQLPELYAGGHELVRTLFIAGLVLVLILLVGIFALFLFFRPAGLKA